MKKFLSKHLALLLFVSLLPQSINAESWTEYAKNIGLRRLALSVLLPLADYAYTSQK